MDVGHDDAGYEEIDTEDYAVYADEDSQILGFFFVFYIRKKKSDKAIPHMLHYFLPRKEYVT